MYKINDYVVYGLTGVCQITDIQKDSIDDEEKEYYVLTPVFSENMTIKTPVDNVNAKMRKVITKKEALSLIAAMPDQETAWITDNRERSEAFKTALKTGKSEELVKLVKTIYLEKEEMATIGKKLSKSDEEVLKAAEKQLNEEIAIALEIPLDKVTEYIINHVPHG
ncbi:MAG: CarD family transcriptional regulator [Syntrophomonadaceae bacterium]|jgi:CarD family transcriptional regulator|nr:CarD family transcriptional regulator [Bacillota bacterium]